MDTNVGVSMSPAITLKTRLQLSFLFIGVISIFVTGWQAYVSARSSLEEATFQRLTAQRESKRKLLEYYFSRVRADVLSRSIDRSIVTAAQRLISSFREITRHVNDRNNVATEIANVFNSDTSELLRTWMDQVREYDAELGQHCEILGYYDIFIVDALHGDVVYSLRREADFGTNLFEGPFADSNLSELLRGLNESGDSASVRFVDVAPYPPSMHAPACFVGSPIFENGHYIAALVFQLSIDDINSVMTEKHGRNHDGMGASGETYIVGTDFLMRNDSRFFLDEPERYYSMLRSIGTDTAVINAIRNQETSVMLQEVRTEGALAAIAGVTDTRIVTDYRGIRVLSSFTPLSIPDLRWIMLSEIDETEAFRPVYELRKRLILIGLVILLLSAILGVLMAQTVTRPILSLVRLAERFGKGELSQRARVDSNDEIGLLASTFNTMAGKIQSHTSQLRDEINVRIHAEVELTRSQEELRNLSVHLQRVREEERKGFAREIHDELGQRLTTMKLQLSLLLEDFLTGEAVAEERIVSVIQDIDATIQSVKRLISELRPGLLDDLGLTAAIEWQTEEFQRRTGIRCDLSISPQEIVLDQERSTAVFRIFQETLTNIARHSGASHVNIYLTDNSDEIELVISDDGCGISAEQIDDSSSFGLIGMRERAHAWGGSLVISGREHEGTVVSVSIPKQQKEEQ